MRALLTLVACLWTAASYGQGAFWLSDGALNQSTSPLRAGLSAYWRFEEAGGIRYDYSKNGNHLSDSNTVGQAAGKVGNAASFTGTTQMLYAADSASLSMPINTSFTIAFWVKRNSNAANQIIAWKGTSPGAIGTWEFKILHNGSYNFYISNGSQSVVASQVSSASNIWDFVVCDYDTIAKYASVQVNNAAKAYVASTQGSHDTTGALTVGSDTTTFLNGFIDEMGIWKRSLTTSERSQLYNLGLGSHYPFFNNGTSLVRGSGGSGLTFISPGARSRFIRPMVISGVTAHIASAGSASSLKWKVFRPNGSTYDYVAESELFTPSTSQQTFTFASPITVREGDALGVWLAGGTQAPALGTYAQIFGAHSAPWCGQASGDITASDTFATTKTNALFDAVATTATVPSVVFLGDSIMAGSNGSSGWSPFLANTGLTGTLTNSIPAWGLISGAWTNYYLNCCISGSSFQTVVDSQLRYAVEATTASNTVWVIHCGVNDVNLNRSWTTVSNNLNTIFAARPATTLIYLDEILPWTGGTDAHALTIRTFNTNYAAWCALKGATLVPMHDDMGTNRVSTGFLDNLKPQYNQDNLHITSAGVTNMVRLIAGIAFPGP